MVSNSLLVKELINALKEAGFATKHDLKSFATKDDLKSFATKDDLKPFATKDDLKPFTTKNDLKPFATKDDLKPFATKDDLKPFATKDDLDTLEKRLKKHTSDEVTTMARDIIATSNRLHLDLVERIDDLELTSATKTEFNALKRKMDRYHPS